MLSYTLLAVGSISVSAARWKEGRDNLVQAATTTVQQQQCNNNNNNNSLVQVRAAFAFSHSHNLPREMSRLVAHLFPAPCAPAPPLFKPTALA